MIELYIENRKIELVDEIELNFTYESIDPDKLSSIKNSFSKTLNIPGTANNNITFGHIFRMDKWLLSTPGNICNDYDPHKRVNYLLTKNGAIVNRGYCTLDNIRIFSEQEITYQITLYGGLGEFFYSLSYNEDGTAKTLYDLFWKWKPVTSLGSIGGEMDQGTEDTATIFKCSPENVAWGWRILNPLSSYEGYTDINRDITFVPCYSGYYEDFDSSHMLVNIANGTTGLDGLSDENKSRFQQAFPSVLSYDNKQYYAMGMTLSNSDPMRYGIVSFSRDIDPSEAGELRINDMPVAIRLSKLMNVISQPYNNGGYEVEWDYSITSSYQWLYGWLMIGRMKQDRENINSYPISPNPSYDAQPIDVNYVHSNQGSGTTTTTINYDVLTDTVDQGTYAFFLNVLPSIQMQERTYDNGWNYNYPKYKIMTGSMWMTSNGNVVNYYYRWSTYVVMHKIFIDNTLVKTIADVFYFTQDPEFTFGKVSYGNYEQVFLSNLKAKIESAFSVSLSEIKVHNCNFQFTSIEDPTAPPLVTTAKAASENEQISTIVEVRNNAANLRIEQTQFNAFTIGGISGPRSGIYGVDNPSVSGWGANFVTGAGYPDYFGHIRERNLTYWGAANTPYEEHKFSIKINEDKSNGLLITKTSGFNILKLDKQTLFASSSSPMKYLADYCKMMNYKFLCDDVSKKIYIMPLKQYYLDNIYDLENKIDYSREIKVVPIPYKDKMIEFGLETPETYPVSVFNKISREKFNIFKIDTGIEWNATSSKLLDNLIFKNTLDWQMSSIFYNLHPQLPSAYSQQSLSWTLFNPDQNNPENIEKHEFFTVGVNSAPENLLANIDWLPKIGIFNKDNKEDAGCYPTLLFLNGFVKNYDHTIAYKSNKETVSPESINEKHYINSSGLIASSNYQDIYTYDIADPTFKYYVTTGQYGSEYGSYVVNYWNSTSGIIGTEYFQKSNSYSQAELHIPDGAEKIKCNFLRNDSTKKLEVLKTVCIISPRITLTTDTYEQYYLNGSRCYYYDFNYTDTFASWGCYSTYKGHSAPWMIPFFSRDLYNVYVPDFQHWEKAAYKLASWNLSQQNGLDTLTNISSTVFIKDNTMTLSKTTNKEDYHYITENEYTIQEIPADFEGETRIYDYNWKHYLEDIYNRNSREVTLYADLSDMADANTIMRTIYKWKGHLWTIEKIENFKLADIFKDKFTKIKLHRISDRQAWI